ncbi:MerR family transcriptional regulator [Anaerocolumna sp. MB42-C2]|uniref:MerR family transcriptional regulator n=1 Tax=Anaerocolumna sp. MB42-C2 TaxID=3070997 RepID=UPI0027DF028B|nr:MerR family transcriptional regulator [Anaerocolumna sp. MB42-C2]WMJ87088.1 MerR family transcriptional regulator [Anaerocolumna sp. MB42-C2]
MRTVKQISDLTGISVRSLHYYDEIGLLKPSKISDAGYRLYDEKALETLQQILFFKELDIPLKEVKEIMGNPRFDKIQALYNHKKLLILKRNRMNDLIELVNKTLEGAGTVSFKEFDMSEYFSALEEFKKEKEDEVIKYWGSTEKVSEFIENCKTKESEITSLAVKQYGSIEKYTEAMKKNLSHYSESMDRFHIIYDNVDYYVGKNNELMNQLTADISKDPTSKEIQQIVSEIARLKDETNEIVNIDKGENYWGLMSDFYLTNSAFIEVTDKKYGVGVSAFIGKALKFYQDNLTTLE